MRFLLKRFEDLNIESILVGVINAVINILTISSAKYLWFVCFISIYIVTAFATAMIFRKGTFSRTSYSVGLWVPTLIFILIKLFFLS